MPPCLVDSGHGGLHGPLFSGDLPGAAVEEGFGEALLGLEGVLSRVLVSQIRDGSIIAWKDYRHVFLACLYQESQGRGIAT